MDEKINLKAVDQYSEAYATSLTSKYFAGKEKISGQEILQFCEIKQVNLFVLRELMHAWKVESQKVRSPYFDYQSEEVIKALQNYQNTVSNHILIARNDFFPLLKKAVSQTLYVVLDPYDFYSDTLDRQGESYITVSDLKNDIKYLKINKQPLEKLVQKLEERKMTTVSGNEAFALLDSILEEVNFTPEDIESYVSQFSKVQALDLSKLYEQKGTPKSDTTKPIPAGAPVKNNEHSNAAKPETRNPKPETIPAEKPRNTYTNLQKINQIKDALTINQKFMFTKILFSGDFEIFSKSIDQLDTFQTLGEALDYIDANHADWDRDSEEYLEFREMLEKRFS